MARKEFMMELVCKFCGMDKAGVPVIRRGDHVPVPIATAPDPKGKLKCQCCHQVENRRDTPWMCQACDVPLCVVVDRNCFLEWHK